MQQAALVSDESALEACLRRCAIQIDDLYLYFFYLYKNVKLFTISIILSKFCNFSINVSIYVTISWHSAV